MKFSTTRILRAAVAIVIITIATVLFVSIRQSQRVRDTATAVAGTEEFLRHTQNLLLSMTDNETATRGFVITGSDEYLQLITHSEANSHSELALMKKLVSDPTARQLLDDSLASYIDERINFSRAVVAARQLKGQQAAASLVTAPAGKFYTSAVKRFAGKVQQQENELLEQKKEKNNSTISTLSTTLYIILAAVFVLSMLIIRKVRSDVHFIIQRRKREEELRKSEERFRLLVSNVKDYAIFMIDADGKVTSWNSGAQHIKGYTAEEIIGKHIELFYPAEEVAAGEPGLNLQMAKLQGHFQKEDRRLRKDGSVFWASSVLTALFDENNNLQGYANIIRDTTELRKNQEQLQFLSQQLNQSNDAIYMVGTDRLIKSWNRGAEKLYGFTSKEAIGRDSNELLKTTVTESQVNETLHELAKRDYWVGELQRSSGSGKDIHVRSSTTTVRDQQGEISGYITVNIDITEQKNLENRLKKFNVELEKQVTQKTAELTGIFERVTDAFIGLDKNYCYRYINKKAAELIHRDPASLIGKKIVEEHPYLVDTKLYAGFNTAMSTQQPVVITEYYEQLDLVLENYIYPSPDGLSIFIRNISEQKKTEKQLETAHERLLFHMENAPLGFIEWDQALRLKSWSKRAEEIFGWTEKEFAEHQKNDYNHVYRDDIPLARDTGRQLVAGEVERNTVQYRSYTKRGKLIWCEWFNSVIKNNDGQVITILSLVQDITERKNAEELIKKSYSEKQALAERMSTILNTLPASIALLDEQGMIMDINDAWKNFFPGNGLISRDYGIGTDYLAVALSVHEPGGKDGKTVVKGILGVLSGRLKDFTFEYSHETGENKKWFRLVTTPLQEKEKAGAVIMHIDITQQKINEEELRLSEQKYKLLFESNPMPMWMRSVSDMHIIDVNRAACTAYGYTKKEFLQLQHTDLRHPNELESFVAEFQLDIPHPLNRGIWKHRKKDQAYIDVEIFAQDIMYNHQKVRLILAKDVTERLKAEEQLKNSYMEIRKLASYLQNIREEERKNMAREIHDQLGQQLTVIKMDISWLQKKMNNPDKLIRTKMEDLRNITDDTINLVRKIASDLRPGLLDDMGLLAAIEWQLEDFQKRSGVATHMQGLKEEPSLGPAAKTNLFRIVQESLTNIARYANAQKVTVTLEQHARQLVLTIQDNGIGFDEEKIASIKTLGILGMRERTAMIGGDYEIVSTPGQGTTVVVAVPL